MKKFVAWLKAKYDKFVLVTKAWITKWVKKLDVFVDRIVDLAVFKVLELVDAFIALVKKQFSSLGGTVAMIIAAVAGLELIGITIIGLNLGKIQAFVAVLQPVLWPIVIAFVAYLIWDKNRK